MRTIHRYQLQVTDEASVLMPMGARVLSAEVKPGDTTISVWAVVDTEQEPLFQRFRIYGTGNPFDIPLSRWKFLNTVMLNHGMLCFHVFWEETP